jgi:hypothetical protein
MLHSQWYVSTDLVPIESWNSNPFSIPPALPEPQSPPPARRVVITRGSTTPISIGCDSHEASSLTPTLETRQEVLMKTIEQPSLEQLAHRKSALERKQRQRAREKARSHQAMVDHLERIKGDKMNAEAIVRRTQRNQCTLGEISPGVDANNLIDALLMAREFARALSIPDVQEGESLYDFERRVFDAWVNFDNFVGRNDAGGHFHFAGGGGAPYLNRETGELSPGHGKSYWLEHCGGFDECWKSLPGAKETIELASLPRLRKLKRPESPTPAPKATSAPTPPPPIPQPQPEAINFAWIAPNAQRYLRGGSI